MSPVATLVDIDAQTRFGYGGQDIKESFDANFSVWEVSWTVPAGAAADTFMVSTGPVTEVADIVASSGVEPTSFCGDNLSVRLDMAIETQDSGITATGSAILFAEAQGPAPVRIYVDWVTTDAEAWFSPCRLGLIQETIGVEKGIDAVEFFMPSSRQLVITVQWTNQEGHAGESIAYSCDEISGPECITMHSPEAR